MTGIAVVAGVLPAEDVAVIVHVPAVCAEIGEMLEVRIEFVILLVTLVIGARIETGVGGMKHACEYEIVVPAGASACVTVRPPLRVLGTPFEPLTDNVIELGLATSGPGVTCGVLEPLLELHAVRAAAMRAAKNTTAKRMPPLSGGSLGLPWEQDGPSTS